MRKKPAKTGELISAFDQHAHGVGQMRRWLATFLMYPALLLALSPFLQASIVEAASVQTTTASVEKYVSDDPANIPGSATVDPNVLLQDNGNLATLNNAVGMLDATMSGYRRLNINAVDKTQFDAFLKVEKYGQLQPSAKNTDGSVDISKLNNSYKAQIGVDKLSEYSRRLIQSILNEVTPTTTNGAGHEYANVFRITRDYRTVANQDSKESVPPYGEEPRESLHYKDNGQAVDVSELDNLRGTKFTIETTVDAKTGKPVVKDGKPVEEVVSYEHEPLAPIQFVWQSEDAASKFPGTLPQMYGQTPHSAAQTLAGNQLGGVLKEELAKRSGGDINLDNVDLSSTNNLGQLSRVLGGAKVDQAMEQGGIQLGPNAPLWTGQTSFSQATGLPSYGFYGQALDGAPAGQTGLLINMGREVVTQKLGLPQGALIGKASDEIFTNVGERTFEVALGNLPLGTLDGVVAGDRRSLEVHIGRGVLAQHLDLYLSQVPLNANINSLGQALGFQLDALTTSPLAYDASFDISGTNATQQLVAGQIKPDDYFQQVGAARLKLIEVYGTETDKRRADSALNLDERPNLYTSLIDLPVSPSPLTTDTTLLNDSESTAASSRAGYVLDHFAFSQANRQLLESIRAGGKSADNRFVLNKAEFEAWLLDTAYAKGVDVDKAPKVARFLAADTTVFYEIGTDQVAKSLAKENDQRAALRSYFRTGVMPTLADNVTPVIDLNNIIGQIGVRSRVDFEAIFRGNAPLPIFEAVGRRSLLSTLGQDPADLASQVASPTSSLAEVKTRLETLKAATTDLAAVSTGDSLLALQQASTVVNQLQSSTDKAVLAGKLATPQAWVSSLVNLYQVVQTAANSADKNTDAYRKFNMAVTDLATGNTGGGLYTLGDKVEFSSPIAQTATTDVLNILNGSISPNDAIRSFGNSVISQSNGLDPKTSQLLFDLLNATTSQRGVATTDIRTQLAKFAQEHVDELAEASLGLDLQTFGSDLNGAPLKLSDSPTINQAQLAEAMVRLITQGSGGPTSMKLGADIIDQAFGIKGLQVSSNGYGTWGMLSTSLNNSIDQVMQLAQNTQKLWEILTDQTNVDLTLEEQGRMVGAAGIDYISRLTGLPFDRRMLDPNYEFSMDTGINFAEAITGKSIGDLGLPFVGDFLADRTVLNSFLKGEVFNGASDFWQNQAYLPHLEQMASQAGIPVSLIKGLLDNKLTDTERDNLLGSATKEVLASRLTAENINEVLGLSGTDFAIAGSAASSAINILLNDSITNKSGALQSLGTSLGDSYFAAKFGYPISWLWNSKTSSSDKIQTGLNILTQATGLDPTIGALAQNAYRAFFIGDGINLSTLQGRQDMASLVGSIGLAAHVPPEFTSLAAGLITGDLETTLVTYAGQSFIDNQLIANGITDVRFSDIYQAFISPLPGTESLAYNTAWNEVVKDTDLTTVTSPEVNVQVLNPNTGEKVDLAISTATRLDERTSVLRETAQTAARANISYAMGDALINKAFGGGDSGGIRGITKAMMTGNDGQKLTAFTGMLSALSHNETASQIFGGIGTARELAAYFDTGAKLSSGTIANMDNWFSNITGVPTPAGSMSAMLGFAKTGDTAAFNTLVSPSSLAANFGGFVDQSLGLPQGSTQLANSMYQAYSTAQAAVDAAQLSVNQLTGVAGTGELFAAQQSLAAAQQAMSLTSANLVATGVNLVFGKQISAIDSALGLPPGTASMFVTAGITALMVPGMTFALLASSVFLPALAGMLIGALFSGNLSSLFGGGTKKIKRTEVLWSYHLSDPKFRPKIDSNQADAAAAQQAGQQLSCKTDDKDLAGGCLKPKTELDRGDWPEEAWFAKVEDPGKSPQEPNIIAPGKNIALKTDKQLPVGIFRGNTQQQFRTGSVGAAQTKIRELLGDLLTINTRLSDVSTNGKADPSNTSYIPDQIWTHSKQDVQKYEGLLNTVYGNGEIGSYQIHIQDYRRGVGFDEKMSLLVRWLHWQY